MPESRAKLLRIVCFVLGGVLAIQTTLFVVHATFSRGLTIPALPSLPPELEAQSGKNTSAPSGTNTAKAGTNSPGTNSAMKRTNSIGTSIALASSARSNSPLPEAMATNSSQSKVPTAGTNQPTDLAKAQTASGPTNSNPTATNIATSTNNAATNSPTAKAATRKAPVPGGRPGAAAKMADLPAPIKERIDRVTQGEILAPVMRPMPMALLGIAGQSAFLRGADGQTGLIKEGDQLGTLKLLRIGTNRVLVEQDGEKKELMIFAGLGSESLLPKPDKTTNEPPKKTP